VQTVSVDMWNAGWGDYHLGYGRLANACEEFLCGGLRVTFDQVGFMESAKGADDVVRTAPLSLASVASLVLKMRRVCVAWLPPCLCAHLWAGQPVDLMPAFGLVHGYGANAFEVWDVAGQVFQPLTLNGLWAGDATGATVQLNYTWTFFGNKGGPAVLRHAWRDYPAILLYGEGGLPVAPFNISISL
jgi:hypothetical protein